MKLRLLALAVLFGLFSVQAIPAQALPSPAFTATAQQTVGVPSTFDATATVCDVAPCLYTWR